MRIVKYAAIAIFILITVVGGCKIFFPPQEPPTDCSYLNICEADPCVINYEEYGMDTLTRKYFFKGELVFSGPKGIPISSIISDIDSVLKEIHKISESKSILSVFNPTIDTCICNESIWLIRDTVLIGKETVIAESVASESEKEGGSLSLNYLITRERSVPKTVKSYVLDTATFGSINDGDVNNDNKAMKIAFLDTGVLPSQIDANTLFRSILNPEVCNQQLNYKLGWNFSGSGSDIPIDDDGHGYIVYESYKYAFANSMCTIKPSVKTLFVKTLDSCGIGSSFSNACGIHYARLNKVDYINCSWGFQGNDPQIERAIHQATLDSIKIICSSGNKEIDLDTFQSGHFPSGYSYEFNTEITDYNSNDLSCFRDFVYEISGICMDPDDQNSNINFNRWTKANHRDFQFVEPAVNFQNILNIPELNAENCALSGTSFAAPTFLGGMLANSFSKRYTKPKFLGGQDIKLKQYKSWGNYDYSIRYGLCNINNVDEEKE